MFVYTEEYARQQSKARSEEIRLRKEADAASARHKAQWQSDEALHKAQQDARNAKGKEARKEARKALEYAEAVYNMAHNPKFFL
jgi:hypothetical protein